MTELENIGKLAATASELLNAIRGGEIANMKAEHTQTLEEFVTAYNAKIKEFAQQKGEALNQFNQEKAQAFAAADSQLQSRRAAVDAVLADVLASTFMNVHIFDGAMHTKSSLGIVADPADNTKSEWVAVPSDSYGYGAHLTKTVVLLKQAYSASGGYPDYAQDESRSFMQFVLAPIDATSEQINARLDSLELSLQTTGTWAYTNYSSTAQTFGIEGLSNYRRLFVRFVNRPAFDGAQAQEITQFGGNARFSVDRAINYPKIMA